MARMTSSEREHRRDARRAGERAALYIRHAVADQQEVAACHQLAARMTSLDIAFTVRMWQDRADADQHTAVREARRAAHAARLALAERT